MSYSGSRFGNPFGFTITPWVKRLLIINAVIFVLRLAFEQFAVGLVHDAIDLLAFTPGEMFYKPWTVVTYMFLHADFFHVLFNMLVLFFFGPPLEERWGSSEFLKFYLICGVGGAVLSLLNWNQSIIGASAAVYGVMVAFAMYWPDNPVYIWGIFPVKAKWLVTFLIGMSVFFAVAGAADGIAHLAHLGGCAAAFFYLRSNWGPTPFGPRPKPAKRPKPAVRATPESGGSLRNATAARRGRGTQDEEKLLDDIDRILDKISEKGISSLSAEERTRLDEASRRFRSS